MEKWMDFGFALDIRALQQTDKTALITGDRSITYGELNEQASCLAACLRRRGVRKGQRVLLFMPNCIEYVVAFFASAKLGLDIAPANAQYSVEELRQVISVIGPALAFTSSAEKTQLLKKADADFPVFCLAQENTSLQREILSQERPLDLVYDPGKAHIFVSTSGSTGRIKFVSNTYQNESINAQLYIDRLGVTEGDVIASALPLAQKYGMAAMLGGILAGCTVVMPERFRAENMFRLIEKYRVTVQYGVPTMFIREMNTYRKSGETLGWVPDISSLRTGVIAGSSGSSEVFSWFEQEIGCRLLNCYGTSEVGGLTMACYEDPVQVRYGTCGRPFRGAEIDIVDNSGIAVPAGQEGEILCRVPWVMQEYYGEPELTAAVFDQCGRYRTGDIGHFDGNGNLVISGRKKDLIIRGGYNVFPAEVEQALLDLPEIGEACVVGEPDPLLGERICAFIRMQEGIKIEDITEKSDGQESRAPDRVLRERLGSRIAKYKLPDRFIVVEGFPRLPNGKYDYPALRRMLAN